MPAIKSLHGCTTEILGTQEDSIADKSNKEIGASLNISKRTVDHHRARIMEKVKLQSVGELVLYAVRNKIVEA